MTDYRYRNLASPIGELTLVADGDALIAILFEADARGRKRLGAMTEQADHPALVETARQLDDYFAGKRARFDLPLEFRGTAFQRSVWQMLLTIPYGETWSYAEVATRLGQPTATRAVGAANGRNPIPIVGPCHRVIGKDGSLTGFGGGLPVKERLLALEGSIPAKAGIQGREPQLL